MKILLVLDSYKYKSKERSLNTIAFGCETDLFYTDYENHLIKIFHALPHAGKFLTHLSYWLISFFSALKLAIRTRSRYTHVIIINPIVGFFYCIICPFRGRNLKIYLFGLLFVTKSNRVYYYLRKKLVAFSLKCVYRIFVYSREEVRHYSGLFPELASRIKFIAYGRDFDIFYEGEYESAGKYIASGGISNRDYNVLASSLRILENENQKIFCRIATRPGYFNFKSLPPNLEVIFNIRPDKFGSFLEKSIFVVLPLMHTSLSAGHMTLLESMYRGKNMIVTDIPAVRDYVDDELVFFYKPGDERDLAEKIRYLYNENKLSEITKRSERLKETYRSDFSFNSFLARIANELE